MFDAFKDGLAIALIAVGFAAGAIVHAAVYLWQRTVPDDKPAKADEQYAASIEHFPMSFMTFLIALIGVIGCGAIVAWGL